ncbi:hypothetical protein Tco_1001736 [Tanacetum coccineum]
MPQDSPLPRVNTLGSDEGSMTQQELMVLCTTLSKKVESLETDLKQTKLIYGAAYTKLIKKVKKLEKTVKSSQARRRARIVVIDDEDDLEDPSKQGRKIAEIDQDPNISLVQHDVETHGRHGHDMEFDFDFDVAKEVFTAEKGVSTAKLVSTAGAAVTTASVAVSTASPIRNTRVSTADDMTIAETLVYIRKSAAKDKAVARSRTAELVGSMTGIRDCSLLVRCMRLQAKEREKYSKAEQARMLAELINQRKRYFAAKRAKERRNKPPTQAQQRIYMSNYIKNMGSYTLKHMRGYSFDEIKTLFETTMRNVKTFVPIESKDDRAVPKLAARTEELRDKEADELSQEELQQMMIIVPEQGMNVEALQTIEGNRHLHAGREGVSIIKGNSYIDVGRKALGGSR